MASKINMASVPMKYQKTVDHATHAKKLLMGNVFQNALPTNQNAPPRPTQDSALLNFQFFCHRMRFHMQHGNPSFV
jgi:hypothetical protein